MAGERKARPSARELGFKAAATVEGIAVATWLFDPDADEFFVVFLESGRVAWIPTERIKVDTSCFIDGRKVAEKAAGAYPGEITYQPPEDDEG